jgi:septum formation protein
MTRDFVYLASASPRRRELLAQIGVGFEVRLADVDETRLDGEEPDDYVMRLAAAKADSVAAASGVEAGVPVVAADTIVVLDGEPLGKPADESEACAMLERLSDRAHEVLTAVAIRCDSELRAGLTRSEVRFRATTAAEREAYCRTGGAYGIQGRGAVFVEHLRGSYSAVMGLPLFETAALLRQFGMPAWLSGTEHG